MADNSQHNLANMDTDSFALPGQDKGQKVVINIQDDQNGPDLVLDKKQITGGSIVDKINRFLVNHSQVKTQDKATFYHLLGVMVNAGIPMVTALRSLSNQSEKSPKLKFILEDIATAIEEGTSLSEAMLNYPDVFLEQEVGMIQSGEASGQLNRVLENLASDAEKSQAIKSKVKSAMMYPTVVFFILIAVVSAMMIFVVPKLTELFESSGGDLPLITKIVVGLSDFMVNQKFVLFSSVLVLFVFFSLFKKTIVGKVFFDRVKISIPIFGALFRKAYLARFARSLSNLIDSNISIVKALEITANSMGNEIYRERLLMAVEDIKQGIPLAENLMESPLFPTMLVNMIDVGEKTAQLDTITGKVASFYEDEVDTAVAGISKIIEPVILIVIGLTVGSVVAAIMLPIMKLSDIAGSL